MKTETNATWGLLLLCCSTIAGAQDSPYIPEDYAITFRDEFSEPIVLDTDGDGQEYWAPWWVGWDQHYLSNNGDKAFKTWRGFIGGGTVPIGNDIVLHEASYGSLKLYGWKTPDKYKANVEGMPFIAGMISGQRHHSQAEGYWETRIRFSISKGHHWALWLQPQDDAWPPEVDILEVVGHQPDYTFRNLHWNSPEGEHRSAIEWEIGPHTDDWHIIGFKWEGEKLEWYFDGELKKWMVNRNEAGEPIFTGPLYWMISPEISSDWTGEPQEWNGDPTTSTRWPMKAELDYVRIYKRHEAQRSDPQSGEGD